MRDKECYFCDCYDEDFGCTMPAIDKVYACPLNEDIDDCLDCSCFSAFAPDGCVLKADEQS